jgi:hypothetical protein
VPKLIPPCQKQIEGRYHQQKIGKSPSLLVQNYPCYQRSQSSTDRNSAVSTTYHPSLTHFPRLRCLIVNDLGPQRLRLNKVCGFQTPHRGHLMTCRTPYRRHFVAVRSWHGINAACIGRRRIIGYWWLAMRRMMVHRFWLCWRGSCVGR